MNLTKKYILAVLTAGTQYVPAFCMHEALAALNDHTIHRANIGLMPMQLLPVYQRNVVHRNALMKSLILHEKTR